MDLTWLFDILNSAWGLLLFLPLAGYTCWANPYEYNTFAQCVDAIGGNEGTIMIPNEQVISDNDIIPANILLRVIQGGFFTVALGKTLTINGQIEAPPVQIFFGPGTVVVNTYPREQAWWGNPQRLDVDSITWQTCPPVKLDDWATPDDNADLNSTLTEHGLLPKLAGGVTKFLRADGTWVVPSAAVPSGLIAIFDANCPVGWTRVSDWDDKFLRGNVAYGGVGGTVQHLHSCDPPEATTGDPSSGEECEPGPTPVARDPHTHTVTVPDFNTANATGEDHLPPYIEVIFCKKD